MMSKRSSRYRLGSEIEGKMSTRMMGMYNCGI